MIFKTFDPNQDVVSGRTTRVASGFWPNGLTNWSQSLFVDDFFSLTSSGAPSPSYGTSPYDVRRTMYYVNVYPHQSYKTNSDPYFSITYGHVGGDVGSGSFAFETASIQASPTKAIYTQYKNMLLGSSDLDGKFTMKSGSTTVNANDIWVIDFSAYKMKDRADEGLLELSFSGSNGIFTFIDDSRYSTQTQAVYQLFTGSLSSLPLTPSYEGIGMFYPSNGTVILNAELLAKRVGISYNKGTETYNLNNGLGFDGVGPNTDKTWPYNPSLESRTGVNYTYNHRTLFESLILCDQNTMKVRKSEYVPARHYFVRVMNRDFNYSNNPTYVYDGTDGIHAKGTIRNSDFVNDPKTYITTVGLYNDNNELVAVAKLSRPAVKSFDQELLIKVRLDF
jgi:hypothetical protein